MRTNLIISVAALNSLTYEFYSHLEEYSSIYNYKDFAKASLMVFCKVFEMDKACVERAFKEVEEMLPKIDWGSLDTKL
jgi:hypothetical protein